MSATARELRPVPAIETVLRSQLGLMARAHRVAIGVLAVAVGLGAAAVSWGWPTEHLGPLSLSQLGARAHALLELVAVFWPVMVTWKGEGPSERTLHWTQPVDRTRHQLLRTAAGGAWLLVGVTIAGVAAWIGGALVRGGMAAGSLPIYPALLGSLVLLYLLGSIPTLLSDHPVWWIVGVYAGSGMLMAVAHAAGWPIADPLQAAFGFERWGLARAISAPTVLAGEAFGPGPSGSGAPWDTLALWLIVATAGVVAAASVHQERSGSG